MKKNIFLFSGVVVFVALFYNQEPGLNLSLFCLLAVASLLVLVPANQRNRQFWLAAICAVVSALGFAWYGGPLNVLTLFCSMVLLGFKAFYPGLNSVLLPVMAAINFLAFPFKVLSVKKWIQLPQGTFSNLVSRLLSYVIIPLGLVSIFLVIYSVASKQFASYFTVNWDTNLFQIIPLSFAGFFLLFNFYHYYVPDQATTLSQKMTDDFPADRLFTRSGIPGLPDHNFLRKSGTITLICLNIVLIVFIATYLNEQYNAGTVYGNMTDALHGRVFVLIFSILIAIALIMVYFNGALNFDKQSDVLRTLTYTWILLNVVLVLSVAAINAKYILYFGLTFKRIGVFIFLLLTLTGLCFTVLKVKQRKTNVYLVNRMLWAGYLALVLFSVINWSNIVTRFNFSTAHSYDAEYTLHLPYNAALLKAAGKLPADAIMEIQKEKQRPLLSRHLYYQFLKISE